MAVAQTAQGTRATTPRVPYLPQDKVEEVGRLLLPLAFSRVLRTIILEYITPHPGHSIPTHFFKRRMRQM
jgi:hypothetical protein